MSLVVYVCAGPNDEIWSKTITTQGDRGQMLVTTNEQRTLWEAMMRMPAGHEVSSPVWEWRSSPGSATWASSRSCPTVSKAGSHTVASRTVIAVRACPSRSNPIL